MSAAVIPVTAVTSGLGCLLNSVVFYLVLSQGKKRYHRLFAGVLAICAVWDLCVFLVMVRNNHLDEVAAYGYVIIPCAALPALMYHFACEYLGQPRKRTTILVWLIAILSVASMIAGLIGRIDGVFQYPWGNIFRPDEKLRVANAIALPVWLAITLPACWFIYQAYRREEGPVARRHLLYILVSLLAISLAIVKVVVILGVEQGFYLTAGMVLTDISAAVIGAAILKDRLFDITAIVRVGLIYSALAALVILVFSVSEHMLTTYLAERVAGHSDLLHIIAISVAIAVLMPVKRRMEHAVDGYFSERRLRF